ncbi:dipeptidase [Acidobacteriota bacterium]
MRKNTIRITRRTALKMMAGTAGAVISAPMINLGQYRLFGWSDDTYSARAVALMEKATVIDMLSPLSIQAGEYTQWTQNPDTFTEDNLKKYKASGINVFHIAVGVGGPDAYNAVLKYIMGWTSFLANHDRYFMRIDSAEDLNRVNGSGKIGAIIGVQNSEHFKTPRDVKYFHSIGQRVSQLTYNARNRIGSGSTERADGGLSDFGVNIIKQMNKVGMAVDVSHCADQTTLDAFEASSAPVLITHSNCRAITPGHPRCKTDEAIKKMAETGGVMGITGVRNFVTPQEPTTIEHFVDHIDHVAKLIGIERVGLGSDMDLEGYDAMPAGQISALKKAYKDSYAFRDKLDIEGLDHPKRMFDVTEALIRRGYNDTDIEGILGGNFKRVLSEIWTVKKPDKK